MILLILSPSYRSILAGLEAVPLSFFVVDITGGAHTLEGNSRGTRAGVSWIYGLARNRHVDIG